MKNKKLLIAVLCISVGCMMLVATAFASSAGTTGYEAYKEALKATFSANSMTADVNVSVTDNGKLLGDADMIMKAGDRDARAMSMKGNITADGQQKNFEMYQKIGQTVIKTSDSDIYYVSANYLMDGRTQSYDVSRDPGTVKAGETIVDALVGNLKDYFTAAGKTEGGSTIDFKISGTQIPAIVNTVASLCAKKESGNPGEMAVYSQAGMPPFMTGLHPDVPKLVEDTRVDEISVKADVNASGIITGQTIQAVVSGRDAEGTAHQVTVDMEMTLSDLGNTTADTVDLEGKQTQTVDLEKVKEYPGRNMD